jgi:hypothetical protein
VTPRRHFTFTISGTCPDQHEIPFDLLVWDTDHGKFNLPFRLRIYNVGPLDFGTARIDDDIPGPSDGNDNHVMEPGETIEYVLAIQNKGGVPIDDVTATLFCASAALQFGAGDDTLKYKVVPRRRSAPYLPALSSRSCATMRTLPQPSGCACSCAARRAATTTPGSAPKCCP